MLINEKNRWVVVIPTLGTLSLPLSMYIFIILNCRAHTTNKQSSSFGFLFFSSRHKQASAKQMDPIGFTSVHKQSDWRAQILSQWRAANQIHPGGGAYTAHTTASKQNSFFRLLCVCMCFSLLLSPPFFVKYFYLLFKYTVLNIKLTWRISLSNHNNSNNNDWIK